MKKIQFRAADFYDADGHLVANCGPGALAAIAGMPLKELMLGIPDFKETAGLSLDRMKSELTRLGLEWEPCGNDWPSHGLVIIAWMERCYDDQQLPRHTKYTNTNQRRHWIAVSNGGQSVFDPFATNRGWLTQREWKRSVLPKLTGHHDFEFPMCRVQQAISVL